MSPTELSKAVGISVPYASQVLAKERAPSRPLAIHIFRKTGWKHPRLAELTDEQIEMLERIEPWQGADDPSADTPTQSTGKAEAA